MTMLLDFLFVNDTATTEIYTYLHTLSLHDALPIFERPAVVLPGEGHALHVRDAFALQGASFRHLGSDAVQDVALGVDGPERLVAARAEAVPGQHVVIRRGRGRAVHRRGGVRRRTPAAVWRRAAGRAGGLEERRAGERGVSY